MKRGAYKVGLSSLSELLFGGMAEVRVCEGLAELPQPWTGRDYVGGKLQLSDGTGEMAEDEDDEDEDGEDLPGDSELVRTELMSGADSAMVTSRGWQFDSERQVGRIEDQRPKVGREV